MNSTNSLITTNYLWQQFYFLSPYDLKECVVINTSRSLVESMLQKNQTDGLVAFERVSNIITMESDYRKCAIQYVRSYNS